MLTVSSDIADTLGNDWTLLFSYFHETRFFLSVVKISQDSLGGGGYRISLTMDIANQQK